jgi:uncharacterized delta-60 repeat protein
MWQPAPTFGSAGHVETSFGHDAGDMDVALQTDGKIVVGGFASNGNYEDWKLGRYNTDGSIDTTFGLSGFATHDFGESNRINTIAIQSDGKIVVAGSNGNVSNFWTVGRYNNDGTLDTSFATNGIASISVPLNGAHVNIGEVAIQPDGKIVTVGYNGAASLNGSDVTVVRQNLDGSLDTSFGNNGIALFRYDGSVNDNMRSVAIQPDGKILVFGDYAFGGPGQPLVVRVNSNGTLDTTFGNGGYITEQIGWFAGGAKVALQGDGKIVIMGSYLSSPGVNAVPYFVRYNPDGTHDTSFGSGGFVLNPFNSTNNNTGSIIIQSDGKILFGGNEGNIAAIRRLNADGSVDLTFADNGSLLDSWIGGLNVYPGTNGTLIGIGWQCASFCDWGLAEYGDVTITPTPTATSVPTCPWSGIRQPINSDGSSIFKLGSTIPTKLQLTGSCSSQTSATITLYVAKITNDIVGTVMEAVSTSAADSGNTFRYDASSAQYIFNLGTKSLTTGTYQLSIYYGGTNVTGSLLGTVNISLK